MCKVNLTFRLGEYYLCMLLQLSGHKGSVTAVDLDPKESISISSFSTHEWADYIVQFL